MHLKTFVFNPYGVNTYILSDDEGNSIIVDPACCSPEEQAALTAFVCDGGLTVRWLVNTHGHFDHVIGNAFVCGSWHPKCAAHRDDLFLMNNVFRQGEIFGCSVEQPPAPDLLLKGGEEWTPCGLNIRILHIPGHSPGSIVLHLPDEGILFAGDVLFRESIGRSDLPGGNFDLLVDGIRQHLLTLPPDTVVWPGHGPATSIGHEKRYNPFLTGQEN
ncbi:MAG: MBL fold metallo-hydrolase [Bacteroidales bacterium]|jgi:glyoxylase-like metal-dependent hydrolase (beta-lactamase superfamily II)|nr:MBL fold metallo-hydrolase [Bacteroidales bacterium]